MTDRSAYKYFDRKSSEWNITDFLDECDLEPYEKKIDCYIKCLRTIEKSKDGLKRDKAKALLSRFQEENKPDRKKAKNWERARTQKQIHIHQPMFSGGANFNRNASGSFSSKTIISNLSNGGKGCSVPLKRTRSEMADDGWDQTIVISSDDADVAEVAEVSQKVDIDIESIRKSLSKKPSVYWKVGSINITQRFCDYQMMVLKKAEKGALRYDNIYEILALSSIIVLSSPCPYSMFTNLEWKEIMKNNPFNLTEPPLPAELSSYLRDMASEHLTRNDDIFMERGKTRLSKTVSQSFNELYGNLPPIASTKRMSEEIYCLKLLYPIIRPFFTGDEKEYVLALNSATMGTKKRPDFSCLVDNVPMLNSEFKPIGCAPLQRKKDYTKGHLRARQSINLQVKTKGGPAVAGILLNMGDLMESFFMDLKYNGLYRSWSFLQTKLVTDRASMPLIDSAIKHIVALEKRVGEISEDYKYRSDQLAPHAETQSFTRVLPSSPQITKLLNG